MRLARPLVALLLAFLIGTLNAACGDGSGAQGRTDAQTGGHALKDVHPRPPIDVEPRGGILNTPAYQRFAATRITDLVHRFFDAAERGDAGAICALYSSRALPDAEASAGCRGFYVKALNNEHINFEGLKPSEIRFTRGGSEAVVMFAGYGRLIEAEAEDGRWFIEEVPGF